MNFSEPAKRKFFNIINDPMGIILTWLISFWKKEGLVFNGIITNPFCNITVWSLLQKNTARATRNSLADLRLEHLHWNIVSFVTYYQHSCCSDLVSSEVTKLALISINVFWKKRFTSTCKLEHGNACSFILTCALARMVRLMAIVKQVSYKHVLQPHLHFRIHIWKFCSFFNAERNLLL